MNPRARPSSLLGFTLIALSLNAQEQKAASTAPKAQTGTIEGHVICEDTRSPARLATVLIVPVTIFDTSGNATSPKISANAIAKTNLEGNYTLPNIAPGDYFILAELRGYLSPLAQVQWDDLNDPTPESIKKLARLLPSVHVDPGRTAHADVVIQRGASISGTVTFDDDSPAIGAEVQVEPAHDVFERGRRNLLGLSRDWLLRTDDRGQYRIGGLPKGEYVIEASVDLGTHTNNPFADGEQDWDTDSPYVVFSVTTFAEKTMHKRNARVYRVEPGEDLSGVDIEISSNGLYSLSGTVTAKGNQPPIVSGFVSLEDVDDKTFTRYTAIHSDGGYKFPYLPPAKYRLKTADVSDQSPIHMSGEPRKPSHAYPETSTTVEIIDQNLSGVTLTIPEAASPPDTPQKPAAPPQNK